MIDHKRNITFIHIPKCAGTSIETALLGQPYSEYSAKHGWLQHAPIDDLKALGRWHDDHFKFTVVRPIQERLMSSYRWHLQRLAEPPSFSDFIRGNCELTDPNWHGCIDNAWHHIAPLSHFIGDGSELDAIVPLSELSWWWSQKEGWPELPWVNSSDAGEKGIHLTKNDVDYIRKNWGDE